MKKIVISAVNFNEGGPLSILRDSLKAFQKIYKEQNLDITVLVHKSDLVHEFCKDFKIIEYPQIKGSWFKRLYFEYYQCKAISLELSADLWISMHDISPNVACKQVVYCHNPSPFYRLRGNELFIDPTFYLFCLFYKYLYGINIRKNLFVIVQQGWLRREFEKRYHVNTIVAYPFETIPSIFIDSSIVKKSKVQFFYPAFPRVAKNFDILLKATRSLSEIRDDFEVILTIDGTENKYAQNLFRRYKDIKCLKFLGKKTREQIFELYAQVDCLVFPSNLETWGLPISEFKPFNKPMLLADLDYAREALGEYGQVKFFNSDNQVELSNYIGLLIDNNLTFEGNKKILNKQPFFENWGSLVKFLSTRV